MLYRPPDPRKYTFLDIASFTTLTETGGDDAAMRILDRIDDIVRPLVVDHGGKVVKQVGDGFMLAFRDPAAAVQFAIETQAELARDPDLPAIRVGINTGPAGRATTSAVPSTSRPAS